MFLVMYSGEFSNLQVMSFDNFEEATEYGQEKFEKGFSVEIIKVAQKFVPKTQEVKFEEVV